MAAAAPWNLCLLSRVPGLPTSPLGLNAAVSVEVDLLPSGNCVVSPSGGFRFLRKVLERSPGPQRLIRPAVAQRGRGTILVVSLIRPYDFFVEHFDLLAKFFGDPIQTQSDPSVAYTTLCGQQRATATTTRRK